MDTDGGAMDAVENKLANIEKRWRKCRKCGLYKTRSNVVFWRGNHKASLVIIGEAPGAQEDMQGEPFIGEAGDLFEDLCEKINGPEPWSSFICNTVGCRPPSNRKPRPEEVKSCRARLYAMLMAVKPKAVLLLGSTALESLTPYTGIMKMRGQQIRIKFEWKNREVEIPAVPTLHPGYLLRNRDVKIKRLVVSDIRTAWELASPSYIEGD
jgi:DNA polymerase